MRILYVPMPGPPPETGPATGFAGFATRAAAFATGAAAAPAVASDALGFGVTGSDALVAGLRGLGVEVVPVVSRADRRAVWIGEVLTALEDACRSGSHDAVLAFHAFWPFTADLRRVLDDAGVRLPLVTYTHGSHWDRTDRFRFDRYPDLRWADLGNLLAADRVLVVSRYLADTIARSVREAAPGAGAEVAARLRVVGLPLDLDRIDAAQCPRDPDRPTTIVFNHAPISAKRPDVFLDVAARVLAETGASVLLTRRIPPDAPWAGQAVRLAEAYPGRFTDGGDLPIDDYFAALWQSRVQVSTATHESLGVATLEAMATGNQCLLPRIGSYPEISGDDPDVLYRDIAELEDRLVQAAECPDQTVAQRHSARVRALYSPARVAAAVLAVLAEAVAAHAVDRPAES